MKVYSFGYAGHSPEHLKRAAEALNAVVVDIRFSPLPTYPRNPWSRTKLEITLGARYQWLKALGNAAYKTGGIHVLDASAGCVRLTDLIAETSPGAPMGTPRWDALILMCGCKEYMTCHRYTVVHIMQRVFGDGIMASPHELIETAAWAETAEHSQKQII